MKIRTFTLCINARGAAEIVETVVNCTQEEHDLGLHYDFAEKAAEKDGYEPIKSFDENEPAGKVAIRGAQATQTTREYHGESAAIKVATVLINNSVPFQIEPLPWNVFAFDVKERANLMPPENVGRDALVQEGDSLVCRHCGREYEINEGLADGDPCPSDDCPSHDLKEPA